MRKYIKEKLSNILLEMKDVEAALLKLIESKATLQIEAFLTDLQQAALVIGNEAEKIVGGDSLFIHQLEEYCELIWQCNIAEIWQEKLKILGKITEKRNTISYMLDNNIPERYEIVFLPYKAAMWDSLESIWFAAREDNQCDCYVIPIPYFDKNSDGSLGEMHYEGDQLPDYVPITHYESYDLSKNHPEVIYFHNPYDQYNYITSVHPDYYSNKLKECTGMLVYVPYFVNMDGVPEHLCTTMGVFRADRVIVESEKVCRKYKDVYINTLGEKQKEIDKLNGYINEAFWTNLKQIAESKFLILGNPKYDKVLSAKQLALPNNWERLINKPDGSKKKVIFYNTTIDPLLKNREKTLVKIKDTLDFFKKQEDIVLLWRPHPLFKATLSAVVPELLDIYNRLVEEYQSEGWGIYDDTADFNQAIVVSDAYYGDKSSIVALYKLTGKPILLQNIDILT